MSSRRDQYNTRLNHLETARSTWEAPLKDIGEQMAPYRTVWDVENTGSGAKIDSKILNDTPIEAAKVQQAGMLAGLTPANKHWFEIGPSNPELGEHPQVKRYFNACRTIIERQLARDGFYAALANGGYLDLGVFGTAGIIFEDSDPVWMNEGGGVARIVPSQFIQTMAMGEYYLDVDGFGRVDTFFRKRQLSARQIVRRFGYEACSKYVRDAWDQGNYHQGFVVIHAVQPNDEHIGGRPGRHGMQFASCWWEHSDGSKERFLRESGYSRLPGLFPRWETRSGDAYGRGPGWYQRATCRGLQNYEGSRLQITDEIRAPALQADAGVTRSSLIPGDLTHVPKGSKIKVEPIYIPDPAALTATEKIVDAYEYRIERGFNVPLWRRLIDDQRNERATAAEIDATKEEKALLQGPLLENANAGLLKPAVEGTYERLAAHGALPQPGDPDGPPPELDGADIKVEFISPLHIMQQAIGIGGLRTFTEGIAGLGEVWPEAIDRVDVDVVVDEYAKSTGMRPDITRPKEEAEAMRRARADIEQQKQQAEQLQSGARSFKDIASADPDNLAKLTQAIGPIAAAQGGAPPAAGAA